MTILFFAIVLIIIAAVAVSIFIGRMSDEELKEAGVMPTWRHR